MSEIEKYIAIKELCNEKKNNMDDKFTDRISLILISLMIVYLICHFHKEDNLLYHQKLNNNNDKFENTYPSLILLENKARQLLLQQ